MLMPTLTLNKSTVDLNLTGLLSELITDYLSANHKLKSFYQYENNIQAFKQAIANRKQFPFYRPQLVKALRQQNHLFLENYSLIKSNIDLLEQENTFTVTTGHQVCVFTGPLYFIYKIVSTINLAEALKKEYPENNFVPVYWLSGEDHDFAEINHIHLFNKKLEWKQDAKGPAGKLSTDSMAEVFIELRELMGSSANAIELDRIFEEAYLFNATLSEATRFLVNKLFGKYGLVVIEGDDSNLKRLYIPVINDELQNQRSESLVEATSASLVALGYKPQVHPRNINLFYIDEGVRERIVKTNDNKFEVLNTSLSFDYDTMMKLVDSNPEKFSPNVVLRPLYQDFILPNLAYVGGPGELSYWLQYKSMFAAHRVHYPVLIPRSSVLLMEAKSLRKLSALGLTISELFKTQEELSASYINSLQDDKFDFDQEKLMLEKIFDMLKEKITGIDKSLEGTVAAEYQKTLNALELLNKKTTAAVKRKHETAITQLKNLKDKVFPETVFQERHLNFIPFYLQFGSAFIDILKTNLSAFENKLIVLKETDKS